MPCSVNHCRPVVQTVILFGSLRVTDRASVSVFACVRTDLMYGHNFAARLITLSRIHATVLLLQFLHPGLFNDFSHFDKLHNIERLGECV